MHTHPFHACSTRQLLGTSVAIIGLASLLASPSTRANGLECYNDEEAATKCEVLRIVDADRLNGYNPVCVENCVICSQMDLSEFETN